MASGTPISRRVGRADIGPVIGHARKRRADRLRRRKLAPVTRAESSPPSLAPPASDSQRGSAPALPPAERCDLRGCAVAWINYKTKFVIFLSCDIHGRVRRVRHRVYSIVPVRSSASDSEDVIGGNGLGMAASQTVQLTRGYTCTRIVPSSPRYCGFNRWTRQLFGSCSHGIQPRRWFRSVLGRHSRHPRWRPRFQAPRQNGGD